MTKGKLLMVLAGCPMTSARNSSQSDAPGRQDCRRHEQHAERFAQHDVVTVRSCPYFWLGTSHIKHSSASTIINPADQRWTICSAFRELSWSTPSLPTSTISPFLTIPSDLAV